MMKLILKMIIVICMVTSSFGEETNPSTWGPSSSEAIISGLKNYFEHLKTCEPGNYQMLAAYYLNSPVQFTFQIKGWEKNVCQVSFISPRPNLGPDKAAIWDCQFDQANINSFIAQFQTAIERQEKFEFLLDTSVGIAMAKQCVLRK